jgi:hypothetical protein
MSNSVSIDKFFNKNIIFTNLEKTPTNVNSTINSKISRNIRIEPFKINSLTTTKEKKIVNYELPDIYSSKAPNFDPM